MKFQYASRSETGPVRNHNEDAILANTCEQAGLFLVADGMGGRVDGEVVSGKIRDEYDHWWHKTFLPSCGKMSFRDALEQLKSVLQRLNLEVIQRYGERTAGSTIVLLFLYKGNFAYLWVGDSRIYRFRGLGIEQITKDDVFHTTEAGKERLNGKLTGAVGLRTALELNLRTDTIRNNDGFFLCSDGVYRFVQPVFLKRKLLWNGSLSAPEQVVASIEKEVLKNGARDNYSMIFLKAYP